MKLMYPSKSGTRGSELTSDERHQHMSNILTAVSHKVVFWLESIAIELSRLSIRE